ncbi:hypothetical protein K8I61_17695 [bacterium]|nr:hypothetical protein [bacterium]
MTYKKLYVPIKMSQATVPGLTSRQGGRRYVPRLMGGVASDLSIPNIDQPNFQVDPFVGRLGRIDLSNEIGRLLAGVIQGMGSAGGNRGELDELGIGSVGAYYSDDDDDDQGDDDGTDDPDNYEDLGGGGGCTKFIPDVIHLLQNRTNVRFNRKTRNALASSLLTVFQLLGLE